MLKEKAAGKRPRTEEEMSTDEFERVKRATLKKLDNQQRIPISVEPVISAAPLSTINPDQASTSEAYDHYERQYKDSLADVEFEGWVRNDDPGVDPSLGDPMEQLLKESQLAYK